MPSLTRAEAIARAALLTVDAVDVDLDLDRGTELFGSRTTIRFTCREPGASTFVDLRPRAAARGDAQRPARSTRHPSSTGGWRSTASRADNVLEVDATMAYSHDGQGLHRSTDPADGEDYVYGHLFLDAAPTVFACFDQPDLKAPYTVAVTAPQEWTVLGNGAATTVAPGAPSSRPPHRSRRTSSRCAPGRTPPCGPSTTASRWVCTRGGPSSRTCGSRPSTCSRPPGRASTTTTGCSASGTRSASTTRSSCPSSTPGRWRTRDA